LFWALLAYGAPTNLHLSAIPVEALLPLLLGIGVRLGVAPFNPFPQQEAGTDTSFAPVLLAVSLAPAAALLSRLNVPLAQYQTPLLLLLLLGGLLSAVRWGLEREPGGSPAGWMASGATLVLASAAAGLPNAVAAWAATVILLGGLLVWTQPRRSLRWPVLIVGVFLLSALPAAPTLATLALYAAPTNLLQYGFLVIHSLLLLGWARHFLAKPLEQGRRDRWEMVIYVSGLALLALAAFGAVAPQYNFALGMLLPALAMLVVAGGLALLAGNLPAALERLAPVFGSIFSFAWFYRLAELVYQQVVRLLRLFSALLEGQAGVLWALLLVALLLSLIAQTVGG
jgi:hypothetical protein